MSFQPHYNRFCHCPTQLTRGVLWIHVRFFKAGPTVHIQTLFSFSLVCKTMEISPSSSPFLCMDLTYITFLLQELGFPKSQVFKVMHKRDCWGGWAGGCRGSSCARSSVQNLPSCYNTCSVTGVEGHCPHGGDDQLLQPSALYSPYMLLLLPKNGGLTFFVWFIVFFFFFFQLARKIDNVETSWALGATFHYIDSLNRLQY